MKREIKFRGKRINNGEWVYGSLLIINNVPSIIPFERQELPFVLVPVDPETVGQYVPIKNGSGEGLYEGDLVRFDADYCVREKNLNDIIGELVFETDRYILRTKYGDYDIEEETDEFYYKGIVVGNKFDNPELIK